MSMLMVNESVFMTDKFVTKWLKQCPDRDI